MNIIIAPDSFKGTLAAYEAADIIEAEIKNKLPAARTVKLPIADGGEGTLDCFARIIGGRVIKKRVTGPNFNKVEAAFLLSGQLAVIEMAQAAGLPIASPRDPLETTTYGVGELMVEAERQGAKHFIIGLGGSATNDAGCGMMSALGAEFFDENGEKFIPTGGTLCKIESINFCEKRDVTVLCDVKNPLYGKNGAAYVYAPQKGADEHSVELLDAGLRHFGTLLSEKYGVDVSDISGAGAAGGMGAGLSAFCNAVLRRGIDAILDLADFDEKAKEADVIITGEGSLDTQSFSGKVIDGLISRSQEKPVIAVVGISKLENPAEYGLRAVFESNPDHRPFEEIVPTAYEDLEKCAVKVAEYLCNM